MNVATSGVVVELLGWMIVHSLWLLVLPFVGLAVCLWLLPDRWSRVRYAASLATLVSMVLLPVAVLPWVEFAEVPVSEELLAVDAANLEVSDDALMGAAADTLQIPVADDYSTDVVSNVPSEAASMGLAVVTPAGKAPAVSSLAVSLNVERRVRPFLPWAVAFWFVGALLMAIRLFFGWRAARLLKRSGTESVSLAVQEMFDELKKTMGVTTGVRLMKSALVKVPSVIGHFQPVILLPLGAVTGLSKG